MAITYEPIATYTFPSAATSTTFSSVSQAYTDIICVVNCTATGANSVAFQFNGDTAANYTFTILQGDGSATYGGDNASQTNIQFGLIDATQGMSIGEIQNYTSTSFFKPVLGRGDTPGMPLTRYYGGLWKSTAAITTIKVMVAPSSTVQFQAGTTITLYGIKAA
jgi:hypothetical protein